MIESQDSEQPNLEVHTLPPLRPVIPTEKTYQPMTGGCTLPTPDTKPDSGQIAKLERMKSFTDADLTILSKTDPDAFGELYQRHVSRIFSYVYVRIGDVPETEDLTSKIFYQALTNIGKYENRDIPFEGWLFRIAHNLIVNKFRDDGRRKTCSIEQNGGIVKDLGEDPIDQVLRSEEKMKLRQKIVKQPFDRQYLLQLKFVEELPNSVIAQRMGRTEGAIKALLHRTIVTLKENLT